MSSRVDEIAPDVFRICFFNEVANLQFNQFLVRGEQPLLLHTGMRSMFASTLRAVSTLINPARLRWIGFSHVEADECGALNEWLTVAPDAEPVCSFLGVNINISDWALRAPRPLTDDDVIETGRHRIRFLTTPHVPHCWDAGLFFEEQEQTLFCSDLFLQTGRPVAITDQDIVQKVGEDIEQHLGGPFAHDMPYTPRTDGVLARLAELRPKTLAIMHGSSFNGDCVTALHDLREVTSKLLGTP